MPLYVLGYYKVKKGCEKYTCKYGVWGESDKMLCLTKKDLQGKLVLQSRKKNDPQAEQTRDLSGMAFSALHIKSVLISHTNQIKIVLTYIYNDCNPPYASL